MKKPKPKVKIISPTIRWVVRDGFWELIVDSPKVQKPKRKKK